MYFHNIFRAIDYYLYNNPARQRPGFIIVDSKSNKDYDPADLWADVAGAINVTRNYYGNMPERKITDLYRLTPHIKPSMKTVILNLGLRISAKHGYQLQARFVDHLEKELIKREILCPTLITMN